jgi:hypothetical protein
MLLWSVNSVPLSVVIVNMGLEDACNSLITCAETSVEDLLLSFSRIQHLLTLSITLKIAPLFFGPTIKSIS